MFLQIKPINQYDVVKIVKLLYIPVSLTVLHFHLKQVFPVAAYQKYFGLLTRWMEKSLSQKQYNS